MDTQRRELLRRLRDAQRTAMAEPEDSDAALLSEGSSLRLQADLRWLAARRIDPMGQKALARVRRTDVGFVLQAFHLMDATIAGRSIKVDAHIGEEPDVELVARTVATLKLLADETRLRIVWNLLHGEHNVNDLASHLGMQPAAISHHLAKLRLAGVVRTRRDGNHIYYAARDRHIERLVAEALRPSGPAEARSA